MIEALNNVRIKKAQPSGGTTTWLGFFYAEIRTFRRLPFL